MAEADLASITILDAECRSTATGSLLRLGIQAYSLGIAYEFDPYFGLSISRVDPLPHQLEAVYDYLLKLARVRFLLADDAGAGKTIMAGLLIRELKLRGLAERILIVCPGQPRLPVAARTEGEVRREVPGHEGRRHPRPVRRQPVAGAASRSSRRSTSPSATEILPGLRQVHWDLVIVDEAHRMSWTPPSRTRPRATRSASCCATASDHILLLTATPHKGDPANFSLFLQLLDADAYADVKSIREAMDRRRAPFYLRRTKEAMVYFPERQPDGTWAAEKIFTKRIPHTVDFQIDGAEFDLYRERDAVREARRAPGPPPAATTRAPARSAS